MKNIKAHSPVVRIFNIKNAELHGYGPFDFNPKLVPDLPDERGRYSARASGLTCGRYSYLYVAENPTDERAALLECINLLELQRLDNGERLIPFDAIRDLAFAYGYCPRPLSLVDVSSRPRADFFGAHFEDLQGLNYRVTRRWGRYFRAIAPGADGIYYCPVRYGSIDCGGNLLLFAEHGENGDQVKLEHVLPFDSTAGRERLRDMGKKINISVTYSV